MMRMDALTEPKFTSAPWYVIIDDTGGQFSGWPSIVASIHADLTIVHRAAFKQEYWGELSLREAIANANLISAAPDMYAALEGVLPYFEGEHHPHCIQIRAALAKARGDMTAQNRHGEI